jgi:hypothetical protein
MTPGNRDAHAGKSECRLGGGACRTTTGGEVARLPQPSGSCGREIGVDPNLDLIDPNPSGTDRRLHTNPKILQLDLQCSLLKKLPKLIKPNIARSDGTKGFLCPIVEPRGLEPLTPALQRRCSAS